MCGIAGLYRERVEQDAKGQLGINASEAAIQQMCDRMLHRGPDGFGYWSTRESSVVFGHRRLSIIDLSEHGHQPMTASSGRYTITYNGEIYNHKAIRQELEQLGHSFAGSCDTEVLIQAIDEWGIRPSLEKLVGMFALAVWDEMQQEITIARDRLGIKPLFYALTENGFAFASELAALTTLSDIDYRLAPAALESFFRHKYVIAPFTVFEGINRLPQGCLATYSLLSKDMQVTSYWDLEEVARDGLANRFSTPPKVQIDGLEYLLRDAVKIRMEADVPLGAFLSGGIDSSIVCSLMQSMSDKPIKTFTIGFDDKKHNEAEHARRIAEHIGSDHHELYLHADDLLEYVQQLPKIIDEPFADVSLIPTLAVSKMASEHVTVALSGDGGDELFGGYSHYQAADKLYKKVTCISQPWRNFAGGLLGRFSPDYGKFSRLAALFSAKGHAWFYECYLSQWQSLEKLISDSDKAHSSQLLRYRIALGHDREGALEDGARMENMLIRDTRSYMADDILQKVDIASMHFSLEARVPLLDHRFYRYVWQMPLQERIKNGITKAPLKAILAKYVPEEIFLRPKQGFGVPVAHWLRGPLRPWCDELLSEDSIRSTGLLAPDLVRKIWREHHQGKQDRAAYLWNIICLQQWMLHRQISIQA